MNKVLLVHPTGNQNVRAVAEGLALSQVLEEFDTCIASFPASVTDKISRVPFLSEIRRRSYPSFLKPFTKTYPWYEIGRLLASKSGLSFLTEHEKGIFSVDAIYQKTDAYVAQRIKKGKTQANAVYAYEDGCVSSFKAAKLKNKACLYDLPIGYWRAARSFLSQEKEKFPEWASTLSGFKDSEVKLARKDEEIRLADFIFVASRFTAKTLEDFPGKLPPVHVIPYGFPPVTTQKDYAYKGQRPLKALFVGGLSQRKGLAYLFEAVNYLQPHVQLTIVGRPPVTNCLALNNEIKKHTWIAAMPNEQILALMKQQDVLLFPSLFEGFGLVITESMAQGTPVVTTERTAGPDLIQHGINGWLTEAGSTQALTEVLETILSMPSSLKNAGEQALETAKLRPWEAYGKELASTIIRILR